MNKTLGWLYIVLSPVSLITAVLSFFRSFDHYSDSSINVNFYVLFSLINLILFIFYIVLGGAVKNNKEWSIKISKVFLLPAVLVLLVSMIKVYSLFL